MSGRVVITEQGTYPRVYRTKDPEVGPRLNTFTRITSTLNMHAPTQVLVDVGVWNYNWQGLFTMAEAQLIERPGSTRPVYKVWLNKDEWYIGTSLTLLRRVGITPSK